MRVQGDYYQQFSNPKAQCSGGQIFQSYYVWWPPINDFLTDDYGWSSTRPGVQWVWFSLPATNVYGYTQIRFGSSYSSTIEAHAN